MIYQKRKKIVQKDSSFGWPIYKTIHVALWEDYGEQCFGGGPDALRSGPGEIPVPIVRT